MMPNIEKILLKLPNEYYTSKGKRKDFPENRLGLKYLLNQSKEIKWDDFCKKLQEYNSLTVFIKRGTNLDIDLIQKKCNFKKIYIEDYDDLNDINRKLNENNNLNEYFYY